MKTAYRIVTPILAAGAVVMGIFLKIFYFMIGNADSQINSLIGAISQLSGGKFSQTYEFSVFELLKMLSSVKAPEEEDAKSFTEVAAAIMPHIVSFLVVIAVIVLVLLAIGILSAALSDSKNKRRLIIGLSAAGIVLTFVGVLISNAAFEKIINGDVSLTDMVSMFSDSAIATLATVVISVTAATLSAGYYAIFGMFLLIIIWTVIANMVIKTPIQVKKSYKRKKPAKKLSSVFGHRKKSRA